MKHKAKGKGKSGGQQLESLGQEEQFPDEPINVEHVIEALRATRELDVNLHGGYRGKQPCLKRVLHALRGQFAVPTLTALSNASPTGLDLEEHTRLDKNPWLSKCLLHVGGADPQGQHGGI
eukprot:1161979-Pelagomonas_calceolata.AAC.21